MTLEEQLAAFDAVAADTLSVKQELYERLVARGLSITENTPFRKYATAIRSLSGEKEELIFQEKIVTPDGSRMSITADDGYTGLSKVIIVGDPNLIPENIAEGVQIYGVVGTAVPSPLNELPEEYRSYKETADALYRTRIGTEPPEDYMFLESNGDVSIGYFIPGTATTSDSYPDQVVLTWDGSSNGHINVGDMFYQVSDLTPDSEMLVGATVYTRSPSGVSTHTIAKSDIQVIAKDLVVINNVGAIVYSDNAALTSITFPEAGFYAIGNLGSNTYVASITYDDWSNPPEFTITKYDPSTTDFSAIGWVRVCYHKNEDIWVLDDLRNVPSTGWNYLKNIRYCARDKLYYQGIEIWPNPKYVWDKYSQTLGVFVDDGSLYFSFSTSNFKMDVKER